MSDYKEVIVNCPHCHQPVKFFAGGTILAAVKGIGTITGGWKNAKDE